jgi:hypothetical protein
MRIGDYLELATRWFDEPSDPEVREALLVCADALAQANDPRGALITMEQALRDAKPKRVLELRRAMNDHVNAHGVTLLGSVASLMSFKRALTLEWRAGLLYGVLVDARYITKKAGIQAGELVKLVIKAPAASTLRRLRVRIRNEEQTNDVVKVLGKRKHPLPLEELEIIRHVWPRELGKYALPSSSSASPTDKLLQKYPNLYYLALDSTILPLALTGKSDREPKHHIADILMADPPTSLASRRLLGRALTSHHYELRAAALQRIAAMGPPAHVFVRVMNVLLQPRVINLQLPIVEALRSLGPSRDALGVVAKVASRVRQYDVETRRAAGVTTTTLRAALAVQ